MLTETDLTLLWLGVMAFGLGLAWVLHLANKHHSHRDDHPPRH